jgi:hypothetical protein
MNKLIAVCALATACIAPNARAADLTPAQQRMVDCNKQAYGMTGEARKEFMGSCLNGQTAASPAAPQEKAPPAKSKTTHPATKADHEKLFTHAKAAIGKQLKDPYSAKYEIDHFTGINDSILCGTVNAKNSYGAYAGAATFMYQDDDHKGHPQMAIVVDNNLGISQGLNEDKVKQMIAVVSCKAD